MKVYGKENCSRCESLKLELDLRGVDYEYIQDKKELAMIGSKHFIMSAPIVVYNDGSVHTYEEAMEYIKKI